MGVYFLQCFLFTHFLRFIMPGFYGGGGEQRGRKMKEEEEMSRGGIYPSRLRWTYIPCNVSFSFIFPSTHNALAAMNEWLVSGDLKRGGGAEETEDEGGEQRRRKTKEEEENREGGRRRRRRAETTEDEGGGE